MKTILVDDELWMLELFEEECMGVSEIELAGKFDSAKEALAYAEANRVDVAFLDIEMPEMNGLELSDALRELYPDIIVIFVSAYDAHMRSALKEHDADWFLLKPYTAAEVSKVLERAKELSLRQRKRVVVKTFGTFDVFVDGKPLEIAPKAKELLALLIHNDGNAVSPETAMDMIWEKENYSHTEASRYRNAVVKLKKTLRDAGIEYILSYVPGSLAMRCDMVECDRYDLMAGKKEAVRAFMGDYMINYPWAMNGTGTLIFLKQKYDPAAGAELYDL